MGELDSKGVVRKIHFFSVSSKYRVLTIGIAMIHFLFTVGFGIEHIKLLFWYNLGVTLFYLYQSTVLVAREKYLLIYVSAVLEILFHAVAASLLLGWEWGFAMYTMSLIPASFYLTYALPQLKKRTTLAIWTSATVSVCFILVRVICDYAEPFYQVVGSELMQDVFYYFNVVIALSMLVLFSSLFAVEISSMQQQLESENKCLEEVANYDPLTQLLNRRSMSERFCMAQKRAMQGVPFCILLLDIDDFKRVNDVYGHDCGDEVLVKIAGLIRRNVREEDVVCRWGGEEILILIPNNQNVACKTAERICQDVRRTVVQYKDNEVQVTLTIGVAEYKQEQSIHALIEEADNNLYYGKQHGKNRVVASQENNRGMYSSVSCPERSRRGKEGL